MTADLASQIRSLIDSTQPVSVDEALRRERPGCAGPGRPRFRRHSSTRPRPALRPAGAVAAGVLLAAGAVTWGVASSGDHATRTPNRPQLSPTGRPVILTAARLRDIVERSSSTASTGTAEVTEISTQFGSPSKDTVRVTFDGANIDERITVDPEPAGSAKPFTTDDRLVGGQFYIDTPGPSGVIEWMHDTDSSQDAASMEFPDPRSLYHTLLPGAGFEVIGTTTSGAMTLTHLRALHPGAMDTEALGNLVDGRFTSFEMWIDQADVVQSVAFTSSSTTDVCRVILTPARTRAIEAQLQKRNMSRAVNFPSLRAAERAAGLAPECGPEISSSQVTISFANLGTPEHVTAPAGAVDFQGKG